MVKILANGIVAFDYQRIIEELKYIGKQTGCYKIILDCSQKNVPFYEKCGFSVKELQMVVYIDENDPVKKINAKL